MELRRVAPVVGLGALLVVDAALIAWALRPVPVEVVEAVSAGASAAPDASGTPTSPAGGATPSPTPSPSDIEVEPLTRVASAVGDDVVWVADSGTCRRPGTVWFSDDRGASWRVEEAPGQVLRLRAETDASAFVTGGDEDCDLRMWSTADGGGAWGDPSSADAAWSRVPRAPRVVDTSGGEQVTPCARRAEVVDLAPLDTSTALVLCDSGQVRTTTDAGSRWTDVFELEGSLALALAPDASAALLVGTSDDCDGVVATPVRNGEPADEGACIESSPRSGEVAAATSGSRWWVVVDEEVFSAPDPEGPWRAAKASLESP